MIMLAYFLAGIAVASLIDIAISLRKLNNK